MVTSYCSENKAGKLFLNPSLEVINCFSTHLFAIKSLIVNWFFQSGSRSHRSSMKPQSRLVIYILVISSATDSFGVSTKVNSNKIEKSKTMNYQVKVRDSDSYCYEYNEELLNLTRLNGNSTHLGATWITIYQDLPEIIWSVKVASPQKTLIDQTVNLCKWMKSPRINWAINIFNNYYKNIYDNELFKCPVKKGSYMSVKPRRKDLDLESLAPGIVRTKNNNFTVITVIKVKGGTKLTLLWSEFVFLSF